MIRRAGCALVLTVAYLAGCQSSAPSTRNFSHLNLPSTSREAAFDAADAAMRAQFAIASSDRATGTIVSEPVEARESTAGDRDGPVVGGPRRVRRTATTRVTGNDAASEVWCKVLVERHDTAAAQMFTNDLVITDAPTGTPADRDAATTPEQNEVWRVLHRDKQEERALLRAIEASFAGSDVGS